MDKPRDRDEEITCPYVIGPSDSLVNRGRVLLIQNAKQCVGQIRPAEVERPAGHVCRLVGRNRRFEPQAAKEALESIDRQSGRHRRKWGSSLSKKGGGEHSLANIICVAWGKVCNQTRQKGRRGGASRSVR